MGRTQAVSGAVVLMLVSLIASTGEWLPPAFSHDYITFYWDTTGFNETEDGKFRKFVVQLYKTKNNSCDDVIHPPMVEEIPVYYLQEATFTRLNLSHLYCSNCTIVAASHNVSCGKYNPIPIVNSRGSPNSFNTTTVTNTSITVTWPTFTQQCHRQNFRPVKAFYYYKLEAAPHEPESNSPLVIFNETVTEGTLVGLTPGKEYQATSRASVDELAVPVSEETLQQVASKVHNRDWVLFANKLGFTQNDLTGISKKVGKNVYQQVLEMLHTWQRRESDAATCRVLDTALRDGDFIDVANDIFF